jgi:hypothetical protein
MLRNSILALALSLAAGVGLADTLLLESITMDSQTASARPRAGMSMDGVESQFGSPTDRRAAVGDPPISRWDYPNFVVYFEYDKVIHSVAKHSGAPAR